MVFRKDLISMKRTYNLPTISRVSTYPHAVDADS